MISYLLFLLASSVFLLIISLKNLLLAWQNRLECGSLTPSTLTGWQKVQLILILGFILSSIGEEGI